MSCHACLVPGSCTWYKTPLLDDEEGDIVIKKSSPLCHICIRGDNTENQPQPAVVQEVRGRIVSEGVLREGPNGFTLGLKHKKAG